MKVEDPLHQQLTGIIQECALRLASEGESTIAPAVVAECAYRQLDPSEDAPILVRYSAVLHMRDVARAFCRRNFDAMQKAAVAKQEDMFSELLQAMYPVGRDGEEVYVRREHMTRDEALENVKRLRAEASAKNQHAQALQAWSDWFHGVEAA